jgi:hypothetical protein
MRPGLSKTDNINQMITLTVITISEAYCTILTCLSYLTCQSHLLLSFNFDDLPVSYMSYFCSMSHKTNSVLFNFMFYFSYKVFFMLFYVYLILFSQYWRNHRRSPSSWWPRTLTTCLTWIQFPFSFKKPITGLASSSGQICVDWMMKKAKKV